MGRSPTSSVGLYTDGLAKSATVDAVAVADTPTHAVALADTGSAANMLAHITYLAPTQDETLTLVTCGGANFAPFPSRLYVTAKSVYVER